MEATPPPADRRPLVAVRPATMLASHSRTRSERGRRQAPVHRLAERIEESDALDVRASHGCRHVCDEITRSAPWVRSGPRSGKTGGSSVRHRNRPEAGAVSCSGSVRDPASVRRPRQAAQDIDIGDLSRRAAVGVDDPDGPRPASVRHERDLLPVRRERRPLVERISRRGGRASEPSNRAVHRCRLPARDEAKTNRVPSGEIAGSRSPLNPSVVAVI